MRTYIVVAKLRYLIPGNPPPDCRDCRTKYVASPK